MPLVMMPRDRRPGTTPAPAARDAAAAACADATSTPPSGSVAILLCTYNGERFLREQLQSYLGQEHADWKVYASDDASTDATDDILTEFAAQHPGKLEIRRGANKGHPGNFLSLAGDPAIVADYYAYSDQDDVWLPHHLSRAIRHLSAGPADIPALHAGRTNLISDTGEIIGRSRLFTRPPSFRNAILQNIAGGNTMVFNAAAKRLLNAAAGAAPSSHDWWTYQLISAAGGRVHYEVEPSVCYRQHRSNLVGSNAGVRAVLVRIRRLFAGRYQTWMTKNLEAFRVADPLLTPENRNVVRLVGQVREPSRMRRFSGLIRSGAYRQSRLSYLALLLAVFFSRV